MPPHLRVIGNPRFVGEHIWKRRLKLRLLQADVAKIFDVCEDSVTGWESGRSVPQIQFCPKIIDFLEYNPFPVDTETLGGRIKKYRIEHGMRQENLAAKVGVDETTIRSWEANIHRPFPSKMKILENVINQKELSH